MKKLVYEGGGHKIYYMEDLLHLNEMVEDTFKGWGKLFSSFTGRATFLNKISPTVVSGTLTAPEGWFLDTNGEPFYFDDTTFSYDAGKALCLVPSFGVRACDPIIYANSASRSPHKVRNYVWNYVTIGSLPSGGIWLTDIDNPDTAIHSVLNGDWTEVPSGDYETNWVGLTDYEVRYRFNKVKKLMELKGAAKYTGVSDLAVDTNHGILNTAIGVTWERGGWTPVSYDKSGSAAWRVASANITPSVNTPTGSNLIIQVNSLTLIQQNDVVYFDGARVYGW